MSSRMKIAILLALVLVATVFFDRTYSQDGKSVHLLKEVIKEEGWEVPVIDRNEAHTDKIIYFQGIPVNSRNYLLNEWVDAEIISYTLDSQDTLVIHSKKIEVKQVAYYSINEKTFAIEIVGSPFGFSQNENRVGIGSLMRIYFFDENGDGKFETRYHGLEVPKHVPNWVAPVEN